MTTIREKISIKFRDIACAVCDHVTAHSVSSEGTHCAICGKLLTIRYPIGGNKK
jgi:ribosomal protein S27E